MAAFHLQNVAKTGQEHGLHNSKQTGHVANLLAIEMHPIRIPDIAAEPCTNSRQPRPQTRNGFNLTSGTVSIHSMHWSVSKTVSNEPLPQQTWASDAI